MIFLYLMFFYIDVMGFLVYYVGLMFLVIWLVDGVVDVLMGLVIDNIIICWGCCCFWLLIGVLFFGLLCILVFYVLDFGIIGKLLYVFVIYLCLLFFYILVNILFCVMLLFLISDFVECIMLLVVCILLGFFGVIIVVVVMLLLVGMLGKGN